MSKLQVKDRACMHTYKSVLPFALSTFHSLHIPSWPVCLSALVGGDTPQEVLSRTIFFASNWTCNMAVLSPSIISHMLLVLKHAAVNNWEE